MKTIVIFVSLMFVYVVNIFFRGMYREKKSKPTKDKEFPLAGEEITER